MNFGNVSRMTVGDVAKNLAVEGGAVVGGLITAGVIGKQVEVRLAKTSVATSTMTQKALSYMGNNVPKMLVWYLLKKDGKQVFGNYTEDIEKGILSSVVLDTIQRANNGFITPPPMLKLFGIDVMGGVDVSLSTNPQMQQNMQKVLQENSSLRSQLNTAVQKLASAPSTPINVTATPIVKTANPQIAAPPADHDRRFGMMAEADDRRNRYGAMTPPIEDERNRNFGTMNKSKLNFAGETDNVASSFGML